MIPGILSRVTPEGFSRAAERCCLYRQSLRSVQVCLPTVGLLKAQPWASFLWEGGFLGTLRASSQWSHLLSLTWHDVSFLSKSSVDSLPPPSPSSPSAITRACADHSGPALEVAPPYEHPIHTGVPLGGLPITISHLEMRGTQKASLSK